MEESLVVDRPTRLAQAQTMQRAHGVGGLSTQQRGSVTAIKTLYQDGCAKIRLPHTHSPAMEAVLINTAGGLTGGDQMRWSAEVAAYGRLTLTTQACERIYRSLGGPALVQTQLSVAKNAHLDWLPQETILFAASQLDRKIDIDLADGASLTAVEAVLLGRDAMGESAFDARLRDNWRIRRNGRLLHAEATRLDGTLSERNSLSLLDGKRAFATIVHVAPDAETCATRLKAVRGLLPNTTDIATSATGERIVVRALCQTGLALRQLIVPILIELSGAGVLPRLWHS